MWNDDWKEDQLVKGSPKREESNDRGMGEMMHILKKPTTQNPYGYFLNHCNIL